MGLEENRFLVAFILSIPVFAYAPLATDVFGIELATPFGSDPNICSRALHAAVVWSGQIFFVGACARRAIGRST